MFCKKCGAKLEDDAKFCEICGAEVDVDEVRDESTEETKPEKHPKKKKHLLAKIIGGLAGLCVLFLAFSYFFHIGIWIPINDENRPETIIDPLIKSGYIYELEESHVKHDEKTGINYVDNILIVYFEDDATEEEIADVVDMLQGEVVGLMPVSGEYQIQIPRKTYSEIDQLCEELGKLDCVDIVFMDTVHKWSEDVVPDDPWWKGFLFGDKWSENNPEGSNWWAEAISAPSAWEYNDLLEHINIGIIDSGFDINHNDLVITKTTENNTIEEHGTHVAGIIGATPNNKRGITGLVWDSSLYTWDWKLTKEQEKEEKYKDWEPESKILAGVEDLIVSDGVKVINLSAGITDSLKGLEWDQEEIDKQGSQASKKLCELLEMGHDFVVVQSSGNGNANSVAVDAINNGLFCSITKENCTTSENVTASDIMDRVIIVGAAKNERNNKYIQALFSNGGNKVDICAPGVDVYSTVPGGYMNKPGTSMAAPIVTGVASMVWAADPLLTGPEVKRIVCNNTKYIVEDNTSKEHPLVDTYNMVNAELAVKAALNNKLEREGNTQSLGDNPIADALKASSKPLTFSGVVLKPEDIVIKLYSKLKEGDYEAAARCLDPKTEKEINFVGKLASNVVEFFSGEYISWGNLLLETAGATDVELIKCTAVNYEYQDFVEFLSPIWDQFPGIRQLICSDADVYVEYRYRYDGETYILTDTCHVHRYGGAGWRIDP